MFKSDEFNEVWDEWKQHFREKTHIGYTATSERKALSALYKRCDGREKLAIESINYSMENNWSSIYLKPLHNGNRQTNVGDTGVNGGGTSGRRISALRKF